MRKEIYLATNKFVDLLSEIEKHLVSKNWTVVNFNKKNELDIFDASIMVAQAVSQKPEERFGIILDEYGNGGFIIATKIDNTIVAQVSDEHSIHMTREHNNTNIITMGADLTAKTQIIKLIDKFLNSKFDGGRHMVRIDMLKEMLKGEK